jgi:hypothetical protein
MRIEDLWPIALIFVLVGLLLVFGVSIVSDTRADMDVGSDAEGAANDTIQGLAKMSSKLPLLAGVIVAAIIIGVLATSFYNKVTG